jgi:heme/copper-type cytochrome/quinol oxidase subunit 2
MKFLSIGAIVVIYLVTYFFFQKNRKAWQLAAGADEEYFTEKEAIWAAAKQK